MRKVDLIIHPVRLRILRTMEREQLTTQEISERLDDIPKSSIYRHLKLLLDGEILEVRDTKLVKGIQEKSYGLVQPAVLSQSDIAMLSAEEHISFFTTYTLTLIHDFAAYLENAEREGGQFDFLADRVGYREISFFATQQELDSALASLNQAIIPLLNNEPGSERRQYKLATVIHPTAE